MAYFTSVFAYTLPCSKFIIIISSIILMLDNNILTPFTNFFKKYSYSTLVNLAYYYDSLKSNFTKTIFNVPKHIKGNLYELEYYYHNKPYCVILQLDSNYIHRIYRIKARQTAEQELTQSPELTSFVKRYLGPNEDSQVRPKEMGFYEVEIMYMGDDFETNTLTFKEDELIKIPK
jgi:hypothetical protein